MDCNTSGFSVPYHLLEFAQVHVHCISDAIQPSHLLSSSSAFTLYRHQGLMSQLFTSGSQSFGASALVLVKDGKGVYSQQKENLK